MANPAEPLRLGWAIVTRKAIATQTVIETRQGSTRSVSWPPSADPPSSSLPSWLSEPARPDAKRRIDRPAGIYEIAELLTLEFIADEDLFVTLVKFGFITGGGWIDPSESAYTADPSLLGNANFGFVSKYKKGATVPTGNTEFNFSGGGLNFHSDTYEFLVINQGGTNAQYKGEGTINGGGEYKFQIWAGDNEPDTFRIKIWTEDDLGYETVYYDNGFDQAIGGGNIVIHTNNK